MTTKRCRACEANPDPSSELGVRAEHDAHWCRISDVASDLRAQVSSVRRGSVDIAAVGAEVTPGLLSSTL
jgi:hypothetical protein